MGGEFIGGAADACIMWKKGELQTVLEAAGAKPDDEWNGYSGDPFEFLPKYSAAGSRTRIQPSLLQPACPDCTDERPNKSTRGID